MTGSLARSRRRRQPRGKLRRADRKDLLGQQELDLDLRPVAAADADAEIDVRAVRVDQLDRRLQADPDVGMLPPEAAEPRHQPFRGEHRRHRDGQRGVGLAAGQRHAGIELAKAGCQPRQQAPCPAASAASPRGVRSKTTAPSCRSALMICWLTAPGRDAERSRRRAAASPAARRFQRPQAVEMHAIADCPYRFSISCGRKTPLNSNSGKPKIKLHQDRSEIDTCYSYSPSPTRLVRLAASAMLPPTAAKPIARPGCAIRSLIPCSTI